MILERNDDQYFLPAIRLPGGEHSQAKQNDCFVIHVGALNVGTA